HFHPDQEAPSGFSGRGLLPFFHRFFILGKGRVQSQINKRCQFCKDLPAVIFGGDTAPRTTALAADFTCPPRQGGMRRVLPLIRIEGRSVVKADKDPDPAGKKAPLCGQEPFEALNSLNNLLGTFILLCILL
ncbi:MAG: hypothetical protein OEZ59_10555, partial [Deltaproteobacteria bacterium]|nr:hypothetical protein [Deltaproteobacteria bacterium]